jgi:hypothetical protein
MPEPVDHEVKIRLKASQYLALRHLADYIAQACATRTETDRD